MPFLGQDWRSPGEQWIKTKEGWERVKLMDFYLSSSPPTDGGMFPKQQDKNEAPPAIGREEATSNKENLHNTCEEPGGELSQVDNRPASQMSRVSSTGNTKGLIPHCHTVVVNTRGRERTSSTSLSEVFRRLDFQGAVRDIRRFNYVCKLLRYLISHRMSSLSGTAQRVLFDTIEDVIEQVVSSQMHTGTLKLLLAELDAALKECSVGRCYIGSEQLWSGHLAQLDRWRRYLEQDQYCSSATVSPPTPDPSLLCDDESYVAKQPLTLEDLPDDCIRLILLRLSSHKDLDTLSNMDNKFGAMSGEQYLWRELCQFHFTPAQVAKVLPGGGGGVVTQHLEAARDWQQIYHRLRRLYGEREVFADMLHMCSTCKCLFWKSLGHPCVCRELNLESVRREASVPITPKAFIDTFC